MTTTNTQSGTNVHEIEDGIFRISTPVPPNIIPGGFSFNQYLLVGEEPLLFHAGPKKMFPLVSEAVGSILPVAWLKHIAFSHFEADECGSLNKWLSVAPNAQPVCSEVAALVSINDVSDRPARAMSDGEVLAIGGHSLKWLYTPHLPHGWDAGYLFEENTHTLFCGDLFTQPGLGKTPVTEDDILEPSEAFRVTMDYFSHSTNAPALLERLAMTHPTTLACMHGSVWKGDGATLLRALSSRLSDK
jgi:flavorubredoxin